MLVQPCHSGEGDDPCSLGRLAAVGGGADHYAGGVPAGAPPVRTLLDQRDLGALTEKAADQDHFVAGRSGSGGLRRVIGQP